MKLQFSPLVYLDTSFIVEAYEMTTKTRVPIKISKTKDLSAGFSTGLINAGASVKETKEFPLSTALMYKNIEKCLEGIPSIDMTQIDYTQLPEYFWATGILGVSGSETQRGKETLHREFYFRLYSDIKHFKKSLVLVTNDVYFSSGYDQIQRHLAGSCQGFRIPVRGLFKFLGTSLTHFPICAPLVLKKTAVLSPDN